MKFDMSKFKKVGSDTKSTIMKHPDGHEIKIAHDGLSKKMRDELSKIPTHMKAGGMAGDDDAIGGSGDTPQPSQTPVPSPTPAPLVADQPQASPSPQPEALPAPTPGSPQDTGSQSDSHGASGSWDAPAEAPAQPEQAPEPQAQQVQAKAQTYEQHKAEAQQDLIAEDQAWKQDLASGHIQPETYKDLFAKKDTLGKIGTIFGLMVGGAGAGLSHQPNALLGMMDKEIQNDLEAQKQSKTNAINFIGLNQQHQVQMAQAQSLNTETQIKADTLAHMQANRAAFHAMVESVNKMPMGSPQRAQAEQALGMMSQGVDAQNANLADLAAGKQAFAKMLFGNQAGGSDEQNFQRQTTGMRMLGPQGEARAKDIEEKHFPGLKGQASVPLTPDDRNQINSGMEFDQKLHRFMDWTKSHSGDLSISDKNQGQALAAELQGAYRQATHGGVYKEGEQNFISKLIDSDPTKFFNSIRVMPQLKSIANENQARINQLVKSKGFQGYSGASGGQTQAGGDSSAQAKAWAQANPKDPRAAKILQALGK